LAEKKRDLFPRRDVTVQRIVEMRDDGRDANWAWQRRVPYLGKKKKKTSEYKKVLTLGIRG